MNPRAVQMAKAVTEYNAGSIDTELLGNILAPQYRGWTNNSANYFTRSAPVPLWVHGSPFMGQPSVYGYSYNGIPIYRWFPMKQYIFSAEPNPKGRAIVPLSSEVFSFPPPADNLDPLVTP